MCFSSFKSCRNKCTYNWRQRHCNQNVITKDGIKSETGLQYEDINFKDDILVELSLVDKTALSQPQRSTYFEIEYLHNVDPLEH